MHIKLRIYTYWYKSNKHTLIVNALDHECGVVTTYDLTLTFGPGNWSKVKVRLAKHGVTTEKK